MGCVVAAMVWTYWLAPPILAVTVLFLLAFGAWYLKKVVEPRVLRSDLAQAGDARRAAHAADVRLAREANPGRSPRSRGVPAA